MTGSNSRKKIIINQNTEKIVAIFEKILQESTFAFVKDFLKKFPSASIYFVGGVVRDVLLGKNPTDFDLVVEGIEWNDFLNFLEKYGKVTSVLARQFFTLKFTPKNSNIILEISFPRKEKQIGPFIKDFEVFTSPSITIKEDVLRRDFTINALVFDIRNRKLLDYVGGVLDIRKKIIKAVGKPEERFKEDPSRILRGVRLAVQLDFKIDLKTLNAMQTLKEEIIKEYPDKKGVFKKRVAEEVIAKEFLLAFNHNPYKTIKLWDEISLLYLLLPEVALLKGIEQPFQFHAEGDVFNHTLLVLRNLSKKSSIDVKLAALFHDIGKPQTKGFNPKKGVISFYGHNKIGKEIAEEIINRLRLEIFPEDSPLHVNKKKVLWLVANHMILVNMDPENVKNNTLKKYFLREDKWGKELLQLIKADFKSSLLPNQKPNLEKYYLFEKRIKELERDLKQKRVIDKAIISGKEIMEILNIGPGPLVGLLKEKLLEAQLEGKIKTKKDAQNFLLKIYPKIKAKDHSS